MSPVLVIYTSGTTGLPQGVPCSHAKMVGAGAVVRNHVKLRRNDVGYVCMPLCHSNAWYIGILPTMLAGSSFVLRRTFSASAFEEDLLDHGITFMNYVGQPLHYVVEALERNYGGEDGVVRALAHRPRNRFTSRPRASRPSCATCRVSSSPSPMASLVPSPTST